MTAVAIAKVIDDIVKGRVVAVGPPWLVALDELKPVVDATAIYDSMDFDSKQVMLYEDHPCIAPPWDTFAICYENQHGNVIVMLGNVSADTDEWEPSEPIDWSEVGWKLSTLVFVGGRTGGGIPSPTAGPMMMWQYAIAKDGRPLDLHWVHLVPDYPLENWDMAQLVLLGALNFLNCRNVEIVVPKRSRAETRRLERTGVAVHTINVFPVRKASLSPITSNKHSVPLHPVRGHFAEYGPRYEKGLLFGKLEGRFWVPQYARGAKEFGEMQSDYKLRP